MEKKKNTGTPLESLLTCCMLFKRKEKKKYKESSQIMEMPAENMLLLLLLVPVRSSQSFCGIFVENSSTLGDISHCRIWRIPQIPVSEVARCQNADLEPDSPLLKQEDFQSFPAPFSHTRAHGEQNLPLRRGQRKDKPQIAITRVSWFRFANQ